MWPWAHAAVGYLCYTLYRRYRDRAHGIRASSDAAVLVLGLGTQLPDLIDKPLAWYVPVLPYGRSFAHSLLTGLPLVLLPLVALLLYRKRHDLAVALSIGYLSHLVADGYLAMLRFDVRGFGYLFWPLLPPPPNEVIGLLAHLRNIEGSPRFIVELLLTGLAIGLWIHHGTPGLSWLRSRINERLGREPAR